MEAAHQLKHLVKLTKSALLHVRKERVQSDYEFLELPPISEEDANLSDDDFLARIDTINTRLWAEISDQPPKEV